jgi:pyruvate dehydrogenase E2 component (dihydrolipoamide acetyltransferase)
MAVEVVMPRLGWTATEGVLTAWLMPSGASVKPGDVLFAVEGDKAVEEIESLDGGILHIPQDAPQPGDTVPVGQLLAYILEDGEDPPAVPEGRASLRQGAAAPDLSVPGAVATVADHGSTDQARPAIGPRARKAALELGVDWTVLQGSGRTGRIVERDVRAAAESPPSDILSMSPVARRLARELGVGMDVLSQAFPNVRITADMVRQIGVAAAEAQADTIPYTPTRQAIAANLTESLARAAPVTLTTELNATELVRLRDHLKADARADVPTYNDLFLKILAHALQDHPVMNATVLEGGVRMNEQVDIGLAVHTDRGLLVPVVRHVHQKNLGQLHADTTDLIDRARTGNLKAQDMQGSTFTLTNLGAMDVDHFTPILPAGHTAILGLGRITVKPMVMDEARQDIGVGHAMALSLVFDHKAVDGAPAAGFLQRIKQFAERPYLWLTL